MIGGDADPTEPLFSGDDRILIDRCSFRTRDGAGPEVFHFIEGWQLPQAALEPVLRVTGSLPGLGDGGGGGEGPPAGTARERRMPEADRLEIGDRIRGGQTHADVAGLRAEKAALGEEEGRRR